MTVENEKKGFDGSGSALQREGPIAISRGCKINESTYSTSRCRFGGTRRSRGKKTKSIFRCAAAPGSEPGEIRINGDQILKCEFVLFHCRHRRRLVVTYYAVQPILTFTSDAPLRQMRETVCPQDIMALHARQWPQRCIYNSVQSYRKTFTTDRKIFVSDKWLCHTSFREYLCILFENQ